MVRLVALLQAAKDRDRVRDGRLADDNRLEAPLQGRVLLDVLAVLVQRRRADCAQLAPRQHRLEQVGSVNRALGGAGADHGVQLIQEQDHRPLCLGHLFEHPLEPFLELPAVGRACDQRADVERDNAPVAKRLGHVFGDDPLRQALDDRGLAHAGLADQHRVVLGAPLEDLDDAADLVVTPDDRIELAGPCALGEVDGVLLQRFALAFGFLRIDCGAAAHGLDRLFQRLARQAVFPGETAGLAFVVGHREQEQFAGDELVAALGRFLVGEVEKIVEVARNRNFAALSLDLGQAPDRLRERGFERRNVDAGAREQ